MRKATTTTFLLFIMCYCFNVINLNAQVSSSENGGEKLSMEDARKQAIEKAMEARELREQGLLVTKKSTVNKAKDFVEERAPAIAESVSKRSKKKSKKKNKKSKTTFPKLKKDKLGLDKEAPSAMADVSESIEEKSTLVYEEAIAVEVDEEVEMSDTKRIKSRNIDDPRVGADIVKANRTETTESDISTYEDAEAPMVEKTISEVSSETIVEEIEEPEYGNAEMPLVERQVTERSTDISTRSTNITSSSSVSDTPTSVSRSTTTSSTVMSNPMKMNSTTSIEAPEQELTPTYTKVNSAILNEYQGKLVVLNFWFSKCKECLQEMPKLNALVDKYEGSDVTFLGMSLDDMPEIEKTLKNNPFKYQIVPRAKRYTDDFLVFLYPSHIVVNPRGEIIAHLAGSGSDIFTNLEKAIELGMTMN